MTRREYITRRKGVKMKKRIILAVSVLVLLALAGGGVYWYRLPAKVRKEENFDVVMDRYVSNFCDLVEENQFEQATEILREFRATLAGKRISPREHSYYSFYLLIMENFLWYAQKKYEKMKANFPEMERLLKMQEVSGSPPERLLVAKWNFTVEKLRYLQGKNECGKELELVEDFITENGGENQLECSNFSLLYFVYSSKADGLLKQGKTDEGTKYKKKALQVARESRVRHTLYLDLAVLSIKKKDFEQANGYLLQAHEQSHVSQKYYYCLAVVRRAQGRIEEARKYHALSAASKVYPLAAEEDLAKLKKELE